MFNVLEIMLIRKSIISFNEINTQIFQNKIKRQSSPRKCLLWFAYNKQMGKNYEYIETLTKNYAYIQKGRGSLVTELAII